MIAVFHNAFSLFAIILAGYLLKRTGVVKKADGTTLSMIILNVTLPAAIIVNLSKLTIETNLLLLVVLGLVMNMVMILCTFFCSKRNQLSEQYFLMYSVSGYNIGNFALPFIQSFFPVAIPIIAMFDMGNSIMLAGGTTIMIDRLTGKREAVAFSGIVKQLLRSLPFTSYLVMILLQGLHWQLPESLLSALGIMGNANTFLSMFMIGLYLELQLPRHAIRSVKKVLGLRYGLGLITAVIIYCLPLPKLTTIVLCLLSVSPISTFGVMNSVKSGTAAETVGFASSLSFLISLVLMTGLLLLFL